MSKKKILLSFITLAAIAAAAFLFNTKMDAPESGPAPDEGATAKFFNPAMGELPAAESRIDCRKPAAARRSVGDELNRFWQNTEDDEVRTFIHLDLATRVLTVCHRGQRTAALFPASAETAAVEMVRVSEAQFGDMNGDGKNEFFVFQGQCAEGPCLGGYILFQIDGGKIKKLYDLLAETVELVNESGRNAVRMEKYCFTHEFGLGPVYFSVAEFKEGVGLKTVPYPELRARFPLSVAKMQKSQDLGLGDEAPPRQTAYLKVHDLIVDAYNGKPLAELLNAHDRIVSDLLPVQGEASPADRLELHCDVREILELVSGGR